MPRVYNWQINREMEYPYPAAAPQRQFAAVFDINKCIACQTCTLACKNAWTAGRGQEYMLWNNVETKPYGFYPLGWDVNVLRLLGPQSWQGDTYTGMTIFEAAAKNEEGRVAVGYIPDEQDWATPNIGEDEAAGLVQGGAYFTLPHPVWSFYLQRVCNHCSYPACLAACPRKAIYKRPEDGIVLIDQERCRGYRECLRSCPFKKVMYNQVTRVSEKCIACYPRVEQGLQPFCTINCIGRIRINGWIQQPAEADPESPVDFLVHARKVALPLYPQFGLGVNIYYIPPIHVPPPYLRQMFGPRVEAAIATYRRAKDDPDLLGVLLLQGATDRWIEKFRVRGGEAIGYDARGDEVARVPLKEPVYIRPEFDRALAVFRQNIT
ncbi:MAG: dehydrogenase [Chloroflexi bacterium]|nr:dehydrogenase [Chloroflexota bacterium]